MGFIIKRDYFTEIREHDLDEILFQASQETAFSPDKVRTENELNTQSLVEDMIRHRYDVTKIFHDVLPFELADTFKIDDLVQWSEPAYDSGLTYLIDTYVSHSKLQDQGSSNVQTNFIYKNIDPVTTPEDFDPTKWTKISENGALYVAQQPTTGNRPDSGFTFTLNSFTGNHDQVVGWDKTKTIFLQRLAGVVKIYYTALDRTNDTNSIGVVNFDPVANTFPDNRTIRQGIDKENSIAGVLSFIGFVPDLSEWDVVPSSYFIKEDNRNRTIKKILINIAIYELHKLISPRNIPELRLEAKDDNMKMLEKISDGRITVDLPLYEDKDRGQNTIFGSNPKRSYIGF